MAVARTTQSRDTGRRRWADAARPFVLALERFAIFPRLHFYTLPVNLPEGTPLHSLDASRAARLIAETVFGAAPARWKLERGRGGGLHVHAVSPLPPVALVEYADARSVYDLRPLLAYLAKPADARLCRTEMRHWTLDSGTRSLQGFDALDEQAAARRDRLAQGKRRLPAVSGWTGVRTNTARMHLSSFLLLMYHFHALVLAYLLAVSTSLRPGPISNTIPAHSTPSRPAQRRPRPRAPDRSLCGLSL